MNSLPLRTKLFAVTITVIIAIALALTLQTYRGISELSTEVAAQTEANLHNAVITRLQTNAHAYGEEVTGYINSAFRIPSLLAAMVARNISKNPAEKISRDQLHDEIHSAIESAPHVSAVYAMLEADAYGDRDLYRGSDEQHTIADDGSLASYWVREQDGKLASYKLDGAEIKYRDNRNEFGQREAEWYLCPMEQKKACVAEPYLFEITEGYSEMMTSLTVPVLSGNRFMGVAGIDVNLPVFRVLTEQLSEKLYAGTAKVTLLSRSGLIVASSHYQKFAGRPLTEALPQYGRQLTSLHNNGGLLEKDGLIFVSRALPIKLAETEWSLLIELPSAVALAALQEQEALINGIKNGVISQQLIVAAILAAVALGIMTLLIRSIVSPLQKLNAEVRQLSGSHGDLTQTLKLNTHAELIELSSGFNLFLQKLRDMINALKGVSSNVREMSADNQRISQTTRENTDQQQQEMDNVVTATQEMSATAHEVSRIASDAAGKARDIHATINESQQILSGAASSVQQLTNSMGTVTESISRVASRSDDINGILEVIRSVAEQTNLLALNAAIEAARAGEQGRGFAVVADEVRTLASKTHDSTAEIDALISSLQQEVQTTVDIIEQGNKTATGAMDSTRQANDALHSVVSAIGDIADHINQVATAAEEQSSTSNEITRNLTVIGDATQRLTRLAQEANLSSEEVSAELDKLDAQLNQLNT